ncbi:MULTISPECIES: hypothetical protein [unclassified Duganella]|uniref:hypothetical protein n=1 Tax=unclassified Duganella TaxID=2636909 RepID=UPI000892DDEC|nr:MULTISPECIES: hypothetical protein [unclassified Duganella]OEZ63869.1 hypothetical protein DUGA6_03700 [Duganella sp. HH105]OFA06978.1 hypothetical protein DUGA2_03100 [Duganella sp. HH101]
MSDPSRPPLLVLSDPTPTLIVDYDGTPNWGRAQLGERGEVSLDSGNILLEFSSLLANLLVSHPQVGILLTTRSWLSVQN